MVFTVPLEVEKLPLYQCHKKVRAAKVIKEISDFERMNSQETEVIWELDNGQMVMVTSDLKFRGGPNPVGGYYVFYEDGFQSWSPAKVFEAGYLPCHE
jgi:hypothetical protein